MGLSSALWLIPAPAFRALLALALSISVSVLSRAEAGEPVVVELYTSQGCSACPPADALLQKLALRQDVIALSLNVDYWDYLGWKDEFGRPEHTLRQRAYQANFNERSVYTPQIVVHGRFGVIGSKPTAVVDAIARAASQPDMAAVSLERRGDALIARIAPLTSRMPTENTVWLIGYSGPHSAPIRHGENAGRTITYVNVARSLDAVDVWDGSAPVQFRADIQPGVTGYAVIVQNALVGPILGAARIDF